MKDIIIEKSDIKEWKKKLNKQLVDSIKKHDPEKVTFFNSENNLTLCAIKLEDGIGVGIAIKSPIDDHDEKVGRNKAAGRALKAVVNKKSSSGIRLTWDDFPKNWTKNKIDFITNFAQVFFFKSVWIEKDNSLPDFLKLDSTCLS